MRKDYFVARYMLAIKARYGGLRGRGLGRLMATTAELLTRILSILEAADAVVSVSAGYARAVPEAWPPPPLTDEEQDGIRVLVERLRDPDAVPEAVPTPSSCVRDGVISETLLSHVAHQLAADLARLPVLVYLRRAGRDRRDQVVEPAIILSRRSA